MGDVKQFQWKIKKLNVLLGKHQGSLFPCQMLHGINYYPQNVMVYKTSNIFAFISRSVELKQIHKW